MSYFVLSVKEREKKFLETLTEGACLLEKKIPPFPNQKALDFHLIYSDFHFWCVLTSETNSVYFSITWVLFFSSIAFICSQICTMIPVPGYYAFPDIDKRTTFLSCKKSSKTNKKILPRFIKRDINMLLDMLSSAALIFFSIQIQLK